MKRFFLGLLGAILLIWGVHYWHRVSYGQAADSATNWLQIVGLVVSGVLMIFGPHLSPAVRIALAWIQGRIANYGQQSAPLNDLQKLFELRQKHPDQAQSIDALTLAVMARGAPASPPAGGSS